MYKCKNVLSTYTYAQSIKVINCNNDMNPNVYIGIFRKEILIKLYSDKVAYHTATTIPLKHMTLPKDLIFSNSECMINLLVIY